MFAFVIQDISYNYFDFIQIINIICSCVKNKGASDAFS